MGVFVFIMWLCGLWIMIINLFIMELNLWTANRWLKRPNFALAHVTQTSKLMPIFFLFISQFEWVCGCRSSFENLCATEVQHRDFMLCSIHQFFLAALPILLFKKKKKNYFVSLIHWWWYVCVFKYIIFLNPKARTLSDDDGNAFDTICAVTKSFIFLRFQKRSWTERVIDRQI